MTGIRAFHAELISKQYRYNKPGLETVDWGQMVTVSDPFGNKLRFCEYKPEIGLPAWNNLHQPPGVPVELPQSANVMVDLAIAMKYNPNLKVLLNAGYFDLATPFFEGVYEMQHLAIPQKLQSNIEFQFYESGHMVYAHQAALKSLHDNVAAFIQKTENTKSK